MTKSRAGKGRTFFRRRRVPLLVSVLVSCLGLALLPPAPDTSPLSDQEFQQISLNLSEDPGSFATDNLVSNEASFLHVRRHIDRLVRRGRAYIGVGPDQNFSYIAMSRPSQAYILDIRRDNLLHHLYYKALFCRASDRWEFLSSLFGIPLPEGLETDRKADSLDLIATLENLEKEESFFEEQFEKNYQWLLTKFPDLIGEVDRGRVLRIARKFFEDGLDVHYEIRGRPSMDFFPSFRQLMLETDLQGDRGHYLNSEDDYQFLRGLQLKNRIIPIMGDFAGPKALRAIGEHLRREGVRVSVFYTSNVEFYLFRSHLYPRFVENVRRLPIDERSVFIRSYFNHWYGSWRRHPYSHPEYFSTSLVQRVGRFLQLDSVAPYRSYWDLAIRDYEGVREGLWQ